MNSPPLPSPLRLATRPRTTIALIALSDLAMITAGGCLAVLIRAWANGIIDFETYARLWASPALFVLAFAFMRLYPGVAMNAAEELRRIVLTTTMVYIGLAGAVTLAREGAIYSRGALVMGWALTLLLVPLARGLLRQTCARRPWWGFPAVVLGAGGSGAVVAQRLLDHPELGLKPIAILDDEATAAQHVAGVPLMGRLELSPALGRDLGVPYAILALPKESQHRLMPFVERFGKIFPHIIVVPDLFDGMSLWLSARDLSGTLGLEVKQRLLLPGPRRTKRLIDIVLTAVGGLLIVPLLALIVLAVRLDSPGSAFYGHTRIGQGGRRFKAWKFRSMAADADQRLAALLAADPAARAEWERDHKLRNDPRVTRLGRFLRRTSLDELPQLWNVLCGEMSLIGPRPIVEAEVGRYTHRFHLYGKLKPGMTGLWQVSGRNDTTYAERVDLDSYYVRNWTVWLDAVILTRTVWVVVFGRGAY